MFVTKFNYARIPQEEVDVKEIVETAGYVPRQKTIENLLLCGQRLLDSRMEEYDGENVEEAEKNASVCRVNNLDLVDSVAFIERLLDNENNGKSETSTDVGDSMYLNKNSEPEKGSESPTEGR